MHATHQTVSRMNWKYWICFIVLLGLGISFSNAQRIIKGQVKSMHTNLAVPRATIYSIPSGGGTSTDNQGKFQFTIPPSSSAIQVKALGYYTQEVPLDSLQQDSLYIQLQVANSLLEEVVISKKGKYNNDNPAVDLIREVIAHKKQNQLSGQQQIQFEEYEKIQFGLVNPPEKASKLMGNMDFYFKNLDTVSIPGKSLLPFYLEENIAQVYSQTSPSRYKKRIQAHKKTEYNPRFINNDNIQAFINAQLQPIDLYQPSLYLLRKLFVSPIADNAPLFYQYYITDTLHTPEGDFISLNIQPKNPYDLLFTGSLQISMDGRYAVRQAELVVSDKANLNFVNDVFITLQYQPNEEGIMELQRTEFGVILGGSSADSFYGRKVQSFSKYERQDSIPEEVFKGEPVERAFVEKQGLDYWTLNRPEKLNTFEERAYNNVDSLNNLKSFKALLTVGYLIAKSYYNVGPIEIGPWEYSYSFNNMEGNRFRIGGRTTRQLSEYMLYEGYLAYGARDKKVKYYLSGAFSLNGKPISTYPAHYLKATVQQDVMEPGRGISYLKGDGFFQSFRSNKPTKWLYNTAYRLQHLVEFGDHISLSTTVTHHERRTAGDLLFVNAAGEALNQEIITSDLELELRWAPKEQFYFRNLERNTIVGKQPIFKLQYNHGFKGVWKSNYRYDKVQASVFKRLFLAQLGLADASLTVGKIFGQLPYPLLEMPNIVNKGDVHVIDFAKINSMEFAADSYVKFALDHRVNGFLFNKIPWVRKFKLREIWGVYAFYGQLSAKNNPLLQPNLTQFDLNDAGLSRTRIMRNTPYVEGYAGIDNIFKLFRIEYVKRLSYLNYADIPKDSFRFSLHIHF